MGFNLNNDKTTFHTNPFSKNNFYTVSSTLYILKCNFTVFHVAKYFSTRIITNVNTLHAPSISSINLYTFKASIVFDLQFSLTTILTDAQFSH